VWLGVLAVGLVVNAAVFLFLTDGSRNRAILLAGLPAALLAFGALSASNRAVLCFAALGLEMTAIPFDQIPAPGGVEVYLADVIVLLAFGSWLAAKLLGDRAGRSPAWPRSPVLGWPFLLFAVAMIVAAFRGHELYGASLVGQPLRMVLYAGIAFALTDLHPRTMYKGIVAVFYTGAVWMFLNGLYYIATGTSQTGSDRLSTGGQRYLSLTISLYLASALFLALLNLAIDESAKRRALHLVIACVSMFGVVIAFGRGTFIAVGFCAALILLAVSKVRASLLTILPLTIPFILLGVLLIPRALPDLGPTLERRLTPVRDNSVLFREESAKAIWRQVDENPALGAGFGRVDTFRFLNETIPLKQDSHNGYMYLLAGGGAFALGTFAILLAVFVWDAWRRLQGTDDPFERTIVIWAVLAAFTFLLNAGFGALFNAPTAMLTIWTLLLLPSVVPLRPRSEPAQAPIARRQRLLAVESAR
jgi:hypothetical protein